MSKILYGICGIGQGHLYRQLPILEELIKQQHQVLIFTYGSCVDFLIKKFPFPNVKIVEVWNPYFKGFVGGISFEETFIENQDKAGQYKLNLKALEMAEKWLGKPSLVLSDYEQISAQYAYAMNTPFVTIDQQSKFLEPLFPSYLNGFTYQDEISRINMFFPKAHERIISSFFKFNSSMTVIPPILRKEIVALKQIKTEQKHFVVYQTTQNTKSNILNNIDLFSQKNEHFHLFLNDSQKLDIKPIPNNIHFHQKGNQFFDILSQCSGIISTAGHSLISEAMFLNIPVLAVPIDIYEQQLNAKVVSDHQFGLSCNHLNNHVLSEFIENINLFKKNISLGFNVLFKKDGKEEMLNIIKKYL